MSGHKPIHKTARTRRERGAPGHRFEHWYVDRQVYFITARCRDRCPAFVSPAAKAVFWDRFTHWSTEADFSPWVVSLLDNHYHILGYNRSAAALQTMMRRLHGSVAKLVNDLLPAPHRHFWRDHLGREFFDGCIRDEKQCRAAWRYTLTQSVRHGFARDWRTYKHTRVYADLNECVTWASHHGAFMEHVPYPRYERPSARRT
ncbi:hypothetical protein HED60_04675 [Planctomycetales bacterium ZRK34]|nr:hypothetical protein HED60_04675 [Planctomycetales bacterium ZRK34]